MQSSFERKLLQMMRCVVSRQKVRGLSVLLLLIRRDLRLKYRSSVLGYAWSMMNPLLSMLIVTIVFSHVVKNLEQYPLHVLSGVLAWNFCTLSISGGASSLIGASGLLRKVSIQAWIFPMVSVGLGFVNLLFSLVPFLIIYFFYGNPPQWSWLLVPAVLGLLICFLMGLALIISVCNVFFRDIGHMLEPVLSLCFYATPIIFDRHLTPFPPMVQTFLSLNPFTHFIEAFRAALLGKPLQIPQLLLCLGLSILSLGIGCGVFRRLKSNIVFQL